MKRSKGFTLVELLVVIAIIGVLMTLLLPTLGRARELTKITMCGTHMSGVGKALQLYYADNSDAFPAVNANGSVAAGLTLAAAASNANVYALPGTYPMDNLSLLVYKGLITWEVFLCPSTESKLKDRSNSADMFGFGALTASGTTGGTSYNDYGLHPPQRYFSSGMENKAYLNQNAEATMPIIADKPDTVECAALWSANHPKDGEQIMMFGGTVRMANSSNALYKNGTTTEKNTAGYNNNNIYAMDIPGGDDATTGAPTNVTFAATLAPIKAAVAIPSRYDSAIFWLPN